MEPEVSLHGDEALELRSHGIHLLARCTEKLARLSADPDPNMSTSAVQALGKIGSPASTDTLFDQLTNERVAEEAVQALARIGDPAIGPRMIEALGSSVPSITGAIASVLWHFPTPESLAVLIPQTRSPYTMVRRAAIESLGRMGDPSSAEALFAALDDAEEEVVVAALKSLRETRMEDKGMLCRLIDERFDRTENPKARATMIQIFLGLEGDDVLALMKKALKDPNPRVRANAVEVVAAIDLQEKRKLGILKPLFVDGQNNRVMGNLAIAFGEIDPKAAMQILSTLLNSTEKWERASAVYAARHVRGERIAGWLTTTFTTEPDPDVLRNVIESLSFFSGDEVTTCFVKALSHKNPIVRSGAVKSLGRINDPTVETYLLELLEREEDRNVICEALTALGRISEPSRIPTVARYLQHTDLRVQANAIEAMMNIGSVEIIPHIEPFLNSSDNRVKANASVALWRSGDLLVVDELEGMLDGPNIKQRSSAVYAVGEVGESLRDLVNLQRYLLLVSALQEDLEKNRIEPELGPATVDSPPPPPDAAAQQALATAGSPGGPDLPMKTLEEAMSLVASGKPEAALALMSEAREDDGSRSPYVEFMLADLHRRRGELGPAIDTFNEVNRTTAPFLHTHLHLANLYNRSQEIPQSLQSYFSAIEAQLQVLTEQVSLGRKLLADRRVSDASLLLKDLVSLMAINTKVHHAAGNEFLRYRYYEEAITHLSRAYLTEPNSAELVFGLAVACFKTERLEQARLLCLKLQRQFPNDPGHLRKAQELLKLLDKQSG